MRLKDTPSDCLACTFYYLFKMGSICGSFPFSFTCPHTKPPSRIPKFFKSAKVLIVSIILILPVLINIFFCLHILFAFENSKFHSLFTWNDILLAIGTLALVLPSIIKRNERLIEINGLVEIIEKRKYYGFHSFVTERITSTFIKLSYLAVLLTFISQIPLLIYLSNSTISTFDSSYYFTFKMIVFSINNYIQCISIFQNMLHNSFYKALFKRNFEQIENIMNERTRVWRSQNGFVVIDVVNDVPENVPFMVILKRARYLYTSLVYNYEQMNNFMQSSTLVWWLSLIASLIIDFYILVLLYNESLMGDIVITAKTYSGVIGTIVYLNITQEVYTVVRN